MIDFHASDVQTLDMSGEVGQRQLDDPWLAAGVVALMTNTPVKRIRDWTDRDLIPDVLPAEGRKLGRRYSKRSAVFIGATNLATAHCGLVLDNATFIGRCAMNRVQGTPREEVSWSESLHYFSFAFGKKRHLIVSHDEIYNCKAVAPGHPLSPIGFGQGYICIDIDGLINHVIVQCSNLSDDLNQKALEGRLKPFPERLK